MLLKVYVTGVGLVATIVAAIAASTVHVTTSPQPGALLLMGSLVLLTEYLQLRHYHYRGHGAGLNLMEGVLAPVVYFAGGLDAMLICASALLVADVVRRMDPIKVAFNVAQWTLAAGVASLVVHEITPRNLNEPTGIAALSLAIVVMSVINQATMTTVLYPATSAAKQPQATHEVIGGF